MRFLSRILHREKPRETPEQRLERIVSDTFNSYECRRYREKRAAAKRGIRKRSEIGLEPLEVLGRQHG